MLLEMGGDGKLGLALASPQEALRSGVLGTCKQNVSAGLVRPRAERCFFHRIHRSKVHLHFFSDCFFQARILLLSLCLKRTCFKNGVPQCQGFHASVAQVGPKNGYDDTDASKWLGVKTQKS